MVARNRGVVGKHVGFERVARTLPASARVFHDSAPVHPEWQIVLVFARDLAGLAAVA